ncbi:MAG TPA: alanine dehydrogenase [Casimicrobiaceae bacterium]|nr:alanine dehydrogenase [Casimicrobiaceae bacterium]
MRVGVPKEIKVLENRVGLTPGSVRELVHHGHQVTVEHDAGQGIGVGDADYAREGAAIAPGAAEVYAASDMVVKVKEPQAIERALLRPGQILFTYLHLAPDPDQTRDLVASNAVCIAYETVTSANGGLPLLAPMSEVAGRLAVQAGAHYLEKPYGGSGVLLGGVPGVVPAQVVVLGGGVVGTHAIEIALGMGARVTVLDRSVDALKRLWTHYGPALQTVFSTAEAIERHVAAADLVIGGVLIAGAAAPKLVTRAMLGRMQPGSVIVDVAIDQGGCFETSHATTHAEPTYLVDGIVHYCVANMPGGVPRTSTLALNNATLPFVVAIADKGWKRALADDAHLRQGLNVAFGKVTCAPVAQALGYKWTDPASLVT